VVRIILEPLGWKALRALLGAFLRVAGHKGRSAPVTAGCIAAGRWDHGDPASPLLASSPENETGGCGLKNPVPQPAGRSWHAASRPPDRK